MIHAIRNRLVTEFFYLKYDNTYSHTRKVEPYALKKFKDRWYLLAPEIDGKLSERGMIKTWGLDRIVNPCITSKIFNRNPHINIDDTETIYSPDEKRIYVIVRTQKAGKIRKHFVSLC